MLITIYHNSLELIALIAGFKCDKRLYNYAKQRKAVNPPIFE